MSSYKTPGVYIKEIQTLPASIVPVNTAVPVFIGATEFAKDINGTALAAYTPYKVKSLNEFEKCFGAPPVVNLEVSVNDTVSGGTVVKREILVENLSSAPLKHCYLHQQVQMYFANGGGPCYILSIKAFSAGSVTSSSYTSTALTNILNALKKEDEPTLIYVTDPPVDGSVNIDLASYGTFLNSLKEHASIMMDRFVVMDVFSDSSANVDTDFRDNINTSFLSYGAAYFPAVKARVTRRYLQGGVNVTFNENGAIVSGPTALSIVSDNVIKNQVITAIASAPVELGPCGAVLGVYCVTDRTRGVWKAPANVSLNNVLGPAITITNDDQEGLNVDPLAGKSVNAIRKFTGKGTLIWGSRTLAGNDNEWRYVPVRRLFIMAEESIGKAMNAVVFEPNDANTWGRVKGMIENFLTGLWRDGALAGAKPQDAFFVNVGLGTTMTPFDILEGNLIIEVGMAAVRPAEFIVLKFSHKLQNA